MLYSTKQPLRAKRTRVEVPARLPYYDHSFIRNIFLLQRAGLQYRKSLLRSARPVRLLPAIELPPLLIYSGRAWR